MNMKKLLAALLCVCMLCTLLPVGAAAADIQGINSSSGSAVAVGWKDGDVIPAGVVTIEAGGGDIDINVTGAVTVNGAIIVSSSGAGGTVTFTGGGTLRRAEGYTGPIISGSDVVLDGVIIDGNHVANSSSAVHVTGGSFIMKGGAITGNTSGSFGGGVHILSGSFTMNGGSITGNTASSGGGVYTVGSSFTMNGGNITDNTADSGGGVSIGGTGNGSFTMNGGSITGNTASSNGGGVFILSGSFTMKSGSILHNSARNGGGVYIGRLGSSFTMTGGSIVRNSADANGGGVYVMGASDGVAGGTMSVSGDAVVGGNVTGGTIANGELTGGTANNVYLPTGQTVNVTAAATGYIGVTTATLPSTDPVTIAASTDGNADAAWYKAFFPDTLYSESGGAYTCYEVKATNAGASIKAASADPINSGAFKGSIASGTFLVRGNLSVGNGITLTSGQDVIIAGNGGTLTNADFTRPFFTVKSGARLTLENITLDGREGNSHSLIQVEDGGTLILRGVTVQNGGDSGIQMAGGTLLAFDSTLRNSTSGPTGIDGGLYISGSAAATLIHCTVTDNSAAFGGGICVQNKGTLSLVDCAVTGNSGGTGGGISVQGGTLKLAGSMNISGNTGNNGNNLYTRQPILLSAPLSGGGSIVVSSFASGATVARGGDGYTPTASDAAFFRSDETGYGIGYALENDQMPVLRLRPLPPVISPASGAYSGSVKVTLSTDATGAKIYYTTNGVAPNDGDENYTGPFTVTPTAGNPVTVRAFVIMGSGSSTETVAVYTYTAPVPTLDRCYLLFETNGGDKLAAVAPGGNTPIDLSQYTPTRAGYTFTGWYADAALTTPIRSVSLTKSTTVYAGWKWNNPFTDVKESDWFFGDVEYAYQNGLFKGVNETAFAPKTPMSRAMLVTALWRMEGEPVVNYAMTFTDVAAEKYYAEAVRWAAGEKLIGGYDAAHFGPGDPVTRGQLVAILYRYAVWKGYDVSVGEDANILSYNDALTIYEKFIPAFQWACGAGLVKGDAGSLMPQGKASRAQVAAILHRFCAAYTPA